MDDLKQINLTETASIKPPNNSRETLVEEVVMEPPKKTKIVPLMIMVGVILGLGTGFYVAKQRLLSSSGLTSLSGATQNLDSSTSVKVGDVFGSADEKTFRDQAEGILLSGGIDGEGSHHIERGDNKSQWVYVTSSVVDLDLLIGHKVMVWGETNQGKKAGWLMDVGRLKIVELNAAPAVPADQSE